MGEMCGNGARCICRYAHERGYAGDVIRVETTAGLVTGRRITRNEYRIRLNTPSVVELEKQLDVDGTPYICSYVELGSPGIPHLAVAVKDLAAWPGAAVSSRAAEGRKRQLLRADRPGYVAGKDV